MKHCKDSNKYLDRHTNNPGDVDNETYMEN